MIPLSSWNSRVSFKFLGAVWLITTQQGSGTSHNDGSKTANPYHKLSTVIIMLWSGLYTHTHTPEREHSIRLGQAKKSKAEAQDCRVVNWGCRQFAVNYSSSALVFLILSGFYVFVSFNNQSLLLSENKSLLSKPFEYLKIKKNKKLWVRLKATKQDK